MMKRFHLSYQEARDFPRKAIFLSSCQGAYDYPRLATFTSLHFLSKVSWIIIIISLFVALQALYWPLHLIITLCFLFSFFSCHFL